MGDVSRRNFVTLKSAPDRALLIRRVPPIDPNGFEIFCLQGEELDDAEFLDDVPKTN